MRLWSIRRVVALGVMLAAMPVAAQMDPVTERGIAAGKSYEVGDVDSVNLFNGNVLLSLPIGPRFSVGALSYGLVLTMNSSVWDYESHNGYTQAWPCRTCNSGLGFTLLLARLLAPGEWGNNSATQWTFVGPDGGHHLFFATLHSEEQEVSGVSYTRDGSYLRMHAITSTSRDVELPDGTTYRFEKPGTTFQVTRVEDAHGNHADVTYGSTYWQITDTTPRTIRVNVSGGLVTSVELPAPPGQSTPTYSFTYTPRTIIRSCKDNDPGTKPRVAVNYLTALTLPDGSSYSMLDGSVPAYYEHASCPASPEDLPGMLRRLKLPTGGAVEWTYSSWFEIRCRVVDPKVQPPVVEWTDTESPGISTRTRYALDGSEAGQWDYRMHPHRYSDQWTCQHADERITEVNDPAGNTELHFFWNKDDAWDAGLSYSLLREDGTTGRYLSSQVYAGNPTIDCGGGLDPEGTPCEITGGTLQRSSFVAYDHDTFPQWGQQGTEQATNRRVLSHKTVFDDDPGVSAEEDYSSFDGLGHYRVVTADGTFGAGNASTTTTDFNPDAGTYPGAFTLPSSNGAWILGTYAYRQRVEGPSSVRQDYCFDLDTGALLKTRARKLASGAGATDVVTVNAIDAAGQVERVMWYGGDGATLPTPDDLCDIDLQAFDPDYETRHTYTGGVLATSRYVDAAGADLSFMSVDRTVHAPTGLITSTRDTAAAQVNYEYDAMYRLVWGMPADGLGAWEQRCYVNATSTQEAEVDGYWWPYGTKPACGSGATTLHRVDAEVDSFGRVIREYRKDEAGDWAQRLTEYNPLGWRVSFSEWQAVDPPTVRKTEFSAFDPFGRPHTVTPPDGASHAITLGYTGGRVLTRTAKVGTSADMWGNVVESPWTSTEEYDRQGRLWRVIEKSAKDQGGNPADFTTTYGYDAAGRIVSVASGTLQSRTFGYDGRGFLTGESLPEKGPSGNGSVTYSDHDARGHAGAVDDGPNDLLFTFDRAERPTEVREAGTGGRVLKAFTYGTANAGSDLMKGKLRTSVAHNYFDPAAPNADFSSTETMSYTGAGGRISARTTVAQLSNYPAYTFTTGFTWTALGQPGTISYPQYAGAGTPHTVTYDYDHGYLTGVAGFMGTSRGYLTSLTYHPNGMVHEIEHGNGVTVTIAKNDATDMARPASVATAGVSPTWSTGAYVYDGSGNVVKTGSDTFLYDPVSRLKQGTLVAANARQCASYDAVGNLTALGRTLAGQTCTSADLGVSSATNRLTESGASQATYDAAGSLTQWTAAEDVFYASWYPTGQMRRLEGAGKTTLFGYTAGGERLAWQDAAEVGLHYTLRGLDGKVLREYFELGGVFRWDRDYVWRDGQLAAIVTPTGTKHVHVDHLGSVRQLSDESEPTAQQLAMQTYLPFGGQASAPYDAERMKFTGHERDVRAATASDDLDNMHARTFSPNLARFLSADPLRGNPSRPQSFNLFSYVLGNPTSLVDPYGLNAAFGAITCPPEADPTSVCYGIIVEGGYSGDASTGSGYQIGGPGPPPLDYGVGGNELTPAGETPRQPCTTPGVGSGEGTTSILSGNVTTNGPTIALGDALGAAIGGPAGGFVGGLIGSVFGIGVTGSYVPSSGSWYAGPAFVFAPALGGGTGFSLNGVFVPPAQNPNAIAAGLAYSGTFQPSPFLGSTLVKSPGNGPPVFGLSWGSRIPLSFGASYNFTVAKGRC